jgi:hypothetical protein
MTLAMMPPAHAPVTTVRPVSQIRSTAPRASSTAVT